MGNRAKLCSMPICNHTVIIREDFENKFPTQRSVTLACQKCQNKEDTCLLLLFLQTSSFFFSSSVSIFQYFFKTTVVVIMQHTFHKARVNTASTSRPSIIASIITHKGMTKETFGVDQMTDVLIWNEENALNG